MKHPDADLLKQIRAARERLVPMGACHACAEPLRQANAVFCDDLCGADYVDDHADDGEPACN